MRISVGLSSTMLALCSLGSLGCGAGDATDEPRLLVPSGEFVTGTEGSTTVHWRPDDVEVCEDHLAELDRALTTIWDFLGIPAAERGAVEWYRLAPTESVHDENVCANPSEGIALALSCDPITKLPIVTEATWRDRLDSTSSYQQQRFVMYLLTRYPREQFLELYRTLPADAKEGEVASAFETIYREPLDAVWAAALVVPFEQECFPLLACSNELASERRACPSLFPGGRIPPSELVRVQVDAE